jgi:hypothetical protein
MVLAPAMVWMIAVFMRTYVVPPKVAVYRPAALAIPTPTASEPMPAALSVRPVGSFPVAVAAAGAAPTIELARIESAARDPRSDPVPLPPLRPRILSAAARDAVPLPRPRPRPPL